MLSSALKNGFSPNSTQARLLEYVESLYAQVNSAAPPAAAIATTAANSAAAVAASRAKSGLPLLRIALKLRDQSDLLFFCVQVVVELILSHLVIFLPPDISAQVPRFFVDAGIEMEALLRRLLRDFTNMKAKLAEGRRGRGEAEAEEGKRQQLERCIQFFTSLKAYFETRLNVWSAKFFERGFRGGVTAAAVGGY